MTSALETGFYRIGAVARMTGIALPTLRMWERRYQVVEPERTPAGGRLYTREHVARLALIQAAVQAGHAIGTVARLPDAEIQARLRDTLPTLSAGRAPSRLAVVGPTLPTLMAGPEMADPTLQVAVTCETIEAARPVLGEAEIDVLILELPTLHPDDVEPLVSVIQSARARLVVAVYGFTSQRILRRLDLLNVLCIRAPADLTQLVRICRLVTPGAPGEGLDTRAGTPEPPPSTERQFSDRQLLKLATLTSAVQCECPQHLAGLIGSLAAFERYSAECESRNAEDAAMHAVLHQATTQARMLMESALQDLLKAEGLSI